MEELRYYLERLLAHQCTPGSGTCKECQTLHRIYQFMETEFFSTVIYTETPIQPRQTPILENPVVRRAGVGPSRPNAA